MEDGEQQDIISINIESCVNCASHAWYTRHKEDKYQQMFLQIKASLETNPSIRVSKNTIPFIIKKLDSKQANQNNQGNGITNNSYYINTITNQVTSFPRLGAFEIYIYDIVIFSKLLTGLWPNAQQISQIINNVIDEKQNGGLIDRFNIIHKTQQEEDLLKHDISSRIHASNSPVAAHGFGLQQEAKIRVVTYQPCKDFQTHYDRMLIQRSNSPVARSHANINNNYNFNRFQSSTSQSFYIQSEQQESKQGSEAKAQHQQNLKTYLKIATQLITKPGPLIKNKIEQKQKIRENQQMKQIEESDQQYQVDLFQQQKIVNVFKHGIDIYKRNGSPNFFRISKGTKSPPRCQYVGKNNLQGGANNEKNEFKVIKEEKENNSRPQSNQARKRVCKEDNAKQQIPEKSSETNDQLDQKISENYPKNQQQENMVQNNADEQTLEVNKQERKSVQSQEEATVNNNSTLNQEKKPNEANEEQEYFNNNAFEQQEEDIQDQQLNKTGSKQLNNDNNLEDKDNQQKESKQSQLVEEENVIESQIVEKHDDDQNISKDQKDNENVDINEEVQDVNTSQQNE